MYSLQFEFGDHIIIVISFVIPILASIYYAFSGIKYTSEKEYLFGNKSANFVLIGLSLFSSAFSAVMVIGLPLEIYYYGTQYTMSIIGCFIGMFLSWYIILPVFCGNLDIETPYEYYTLRFNKNVKLLASFIYIIYSLLVMPVILYAPSLTINQITGVSTFICATVISIVCIIYTTFGGFSGVIWVDSFQAIIMIGSYLYVCIAGLYKVEWNEMIEKGYAGGRLEFFNMNPNPLERATFWTTIIGHIFLYNNSSTCTAGSLQRYMSLKNEKHARISTIIGNLGLLSIIIIGTLIGLIMYAEYGACDPLLNKNIQSPNQMLIYLISNMFDNTPGFNGLFITGLFCAALSTLSSVLNTVSGIIYYDFVLKFKNNYIKDHGTFVMKLIVIALGIVYLACVPIFENSKHIMELALSIAGITHGATLGMLLLGILIPKSNAKGVIAGALTSIAIMTWINIGAKHYQVNLFYRKEISIGNYTNLMTNTNVTNISYDKSGLDNIFFLYKLSYMYYSLFGTMVTIIVALIVSYITTNKIKHVDPLLVAPFLRSYVQNKINNE